MSPRSSRAVSYIRLGLTVALAAVLAVSLLTYEPEADRAERIGHLIKCPVCSGESIADSGTQLADDMMTLVRDRIASGATDAEIIEEILGSYSGAVLLDPELSLSTVALWLIPAAILVGGLVMVVSRRRRTSPAEEADFNRQREAAQVDLEGVTAQREAGEIDEETADRLSALYRSELEVLDEVPSPEPNVPSRSESRGWSRRMILGSTLLVTAFAVVLVGAFVFLGDPEGTGAGVADGEVDLSSVSNETMESVIAANLDDPQIDGMRLALAERYFTEGSYSEALPQYLVVAESDGANPTQVSTALSRLGWMTYEGNGEVETAMGLLDEALEVTPGAPLPLYLKGQITWCGAHQPDQAAAIFTEVLANSNLDPSVRAAVEEDLRSVEEGESCPT